MKPEKSTQIATMAPQAGAHNRIPQLDAMRGIAALVVCLGHAAGLFPGIDATPSGKLSRRAALVLLDGSAMVDFFFVLSGFVLALPFFGPKGRRFDIIDFLTRRAARIYPAFWFAMILALVLRLISSDALHAWAGDTWGQLQWTDPLTVRTLATQFLLVFGLPKVEMLNSPIWSICVEVQVAILLPMFFFLIGPARSWISVVAISLLSLLVACMIGPPSSLIFLPLFVMGVALARFRMEIQGFISRLSGFTSVVAGLVGMALIYNRFVTGRFGWVFPDLRPELISALGAMVLIVLADARAGFAAALTRSPLLFLGKISYSLYLVHLPLFLWLFPVVHGATGSVAASILVGVVFSFTLAWIMFHAIEQPCIDAGRWLAKTMVALVQSTPIRIPTSTTQTADNTESPEAAKSPSFEEKPVRESIPVLSSL